LKIRGDEHVSPEVVDAVVRSALSEGFTLDCITEIGARGSADVHWITAFAEEGGKAILTADTDFIRRPHQVMAVHDAGLAIIHLPPKWQNAQLHMQMAHLLIWWKRIEAAVSEAKPRECWRPEWNISESGKLQKIKVDYEEAKKKLSKANRPSRKEVP
jgi:hypothetical protein